MSILDHIEGIGPKRRKALWGAFKNLDAMKAATVEELAAVPGMTRQAAGKRLLLFSAWERMKRGKSWKIRRIYRMFKDYP